MASEILMPKAGMDMQEGTIIRWLKEPGDAVQKGDALLEIETDKVTMEVESPVDGTLLGTLYPDGAVVPVVTVIGYVGQPGEAMPQPAAAPPPRGEPAPPETVGELQPEPPPASPLARTLAKELGVSIAAVPAGEDGRIHARDVERLRATPLAKRVAQERGVDLREVDGSGFGGKITRADVQSHAAGCAQEARQPLRGIRKVVAQRMEKAHREVPPVTMHLRADVTRLLQLRGELNGEREHKLSINDFVLKAAAKALAEHRELLARVEDGCLVHSGRVNIGLAVSVPEGLVVPVIREADSLGLEALSRTAGELAGRAREGGLRPGDCDGSTFTVSNMGMFGIEFFTPIVNQPDSMILGVCSIEDIACPAGDGVEFRKKMGLSLTFDHRVMDGAAPARFLAQLRHLLEHPLESLL